MFRPYRRLLVFALTALAAVSPVASPPNLPAARTPKPAVVSARKTIPLGTSDSRVCLTFSPDGRTLATGGYRVIRFWDVATGRERQQIDAHSHGISRLSFSPDGKMLASGGWAGDSRMRVWEVATGKARFSLGDGEGGVCCVAISPDGRTLGVGVPTGAILFDLVTGEQRHILKGSVADSVAFSPDGTLFATANGDFTTRLWEVASGRLTREFRAEQTNATGSQAVAFSPDGATLASGGQYGMIRLWDVGTGQQRAQFGDNRPLVTCVTYSPQGRLLASAHSGRIQLWDTATGDEFRRWDSLGAWHVAFSPDGALLAWVDVNKLELVPLDLTDLRTQARRAKVAAPVQGLKQVAAKEPSAKELEALWFRLARPDAADAYQALWRLIGTPEQTVLFLKEKLRPIAFDDAQRGQVIDLITKLESERNVMRQAALTALGEFGELAEPALRTAIASPRSPESRRQIEALLKQIEGPIMSPARLQSLRAVEVLEYIGNAEARQVLERLAAGAPEGRLTQESKASLRRLNRQRPQSE